MISAACDYGSRHLDKKIMGREGGGGGGGGKIGIYENKGGRGVGLSVAYQGLVAKLFSGEDSPLATLGNLGYIYS